MKRIFSKFKYLKDNPHLLKKDSKMPWTIYGSGVKIKDHYKRFNFFHFIFKYKFFIPLLLLIEWILSRKAKIKIEDKEYNKVIKIFDKAFDDSVRVWTATYRRLRKPQKPHMTEEQYRKNLSNRCLFTLKKMLVTTYLLDTSYREFLNIFIFKLSKTMQEEFKDKYHLFYTSKHINDVMYLSMRKKILENNKEIIELIKSEDEDKNI